MSDCARLYPGCYLPPPRRRWRSEKKKCRSPPPPPPPCLSAFWELREFRGWLGSGKSMLCPPFSNSWIRPCCTQQCLSEHMIIITICKCDFFPFRARQLTLTEQSIFISTTRHLTCEEKYMCHYCLPSQFCCHLIVLYKCRFFTLLLSKNEWLD